jgi:general secretion pathway protein G
MIDVTRSGRLAVATPPCARAAFSLIEVAIVLVLIGVIAAIAIPRLSRSSAGAADAATIQSEAVLQKAVDMYSAEHCGAYPAADKVADQLTQFTDAHGAVSRQKASPYHFGPYVQKVPQITSGPNKGSTKVAAAAGAGVAWIYNEADGSITANLSAGGAASEDPPTTLPVIDGGSLPPIDPGTLPPVSPPTTDIR